MSKVDRYLVAMKPGALFTVDAQTAGLDAEAFDALASRWSARGLDGFIVDGTPHRKTQSGHFRIDAIWLRKDK
jgi:hypothetical protein